MNIGKVDIVMWAKNGADCLPKVLSRIDKVLPKKNVSQKILVDDHSTDATVKIAKDFGWSVFANPRAGIPSGAAEAFRHVQTDYFISVEQDVVLAENWWDKITHYMEDPIVGSAQGIRVPTHKLLRVLEDWQKGGNEKRTYVSMDNNLFRTKIVKVLGGFPRICPVCTDTVLMKKMEEAGYKWIIDPSVVSFHLRDNLKKAEDHYQKLNFLCARTRYCSPNEKLRLSKLIRILVTSPLRATQVAVKTNCAPIVLAYPLSRVHKIGACLRWKTYKLR